MPATSNRNAKRLSRPGPISLTARRIRCLNTASDESILPAQQPTTGDLSLLVSGALGGIIPGGGGESILIGLHEGQHGGGIARGGRDLRRQLGDAGGVLGDEVRHQHGARALAGASRRREVVAVELEVARLERHPREQRGLLRRRRDAVIRETVDHRVGDGRGRDGAFVRE